MTLTLRDPFLPFLYPNQYVNFTDTRATVAKGKEIVQAAGAADDLSKVSAVFNWVTNNFTYDYDLAANPPVGYLPVVDNVLAARKGICFDYAAVMASMLALRTSPASWWWAMRARSTTHGSTSM